MYVPRDLTDEFTRRRPHYNVLAVVGPRQSGKTTFLKGEMKGTGGSYATLDDRDVRALFDEDEKMFESQFVEGHDLSVLDEVQYGEDAGRKLKYMADKGCVLWVTASSQLLLGKEILSHLVGRVTLLRLLPFSLAEFLRGKGQKAYTDDILRRMVWEHCTYGGYPKVVLTGGQENKRTILRDLYDTMLLKDVAMTFNLEDMGTLERMSKYLAINTGGSLAYGDLAASLGVSHQTVKKYLDAFERSYLVFVVPPYHTNKAKEITKQPRVYFTDTGLRNVIAGETGPELSGKVFENYVLSELWKVGTDPRYWRTKNGAEVDFVVETEGGGVIPVEVKLNSSGRKLGKGYRSFITSYGPDKGLVVYYRGEAASKRVDGCKVVFTDLPGMVRELEKVGVARWRS